jgi:hypothetical protein
MPRNNLRRPLGGNVLKNAALFFCLLAPSIWMIATIPPLWRDADAYVQLTQDPRVATFWGHAPAYCYIAKIPLFLGEQWERIHGYTPPRALASQPALSDSGIWLLIGAQHLSLAAAALLFITSVSAVFWMRVALALVWASNALFYTFAHCVGSETLGMILVILFVTKTVNLVQHSTEPTWRAWYCFALLLLLCLLSRDLNLSLIILLPAAFMIARLLEGRALSRPNSLKTKRWSFLQNAAVAIAIGLACVAFAHSIPEGLARKTRLHPHSRLGYTFLWRLHFLQELAPASRAALIDQVAQRASSEKVRNLIRLHEQMIAEQAEPLDPTAFVNRAIASFGGSLHWEDLDAALKQMAWTYLWPPGPELLHAVRTDFFSALRLPPTVISNYLFATTSYYFGNKEELSGLAPLLTFRGEANPDRIQQLFSKHRYFHLWQRVTWRSAFAAWFLLVLVFVIVAQRKHVPASNTLALALTLLAVGLLQLGVSCILHDYEPRFSLPMWEFLLLSLFVLLGKTFDLLCDASRYEAAPEEGKSAGQLFPPEP